MRRTKSHLSKVALILSLCLLAPRAAHAVGEVNGRIQGTITEAQSGAPVPGATVTATSSSLIGGAKHTTSDDGGLFEFIELPAGSYLVEVSYAGVKPIKRRIVVRQGEAAPLNIAWSPELAQTETTTVVETRVMTRPDSTQTGTVLSADTESKIASGRSYQGIAQQVAGVIDVNGGGNPQIKGANYTMTRFLVDGLDITDPTTGTFSANINFDSLGSVDVITGGMEAEYNSLGGVINVVTNAGSDEWHVDSSLYINNENFSLHHQYGGQLYQGLRQFSLVKVPPSQSYQVNVNVGGPLVKHRLWFNFSFEYDYNQFVQPAGPPLNIQQPPQTSNAYLVRLKLTWAPSDKHRVTLSVSGDPTDFHNTDSAGLTPNHQLAIAQDYQKQGGTFAILQWDYFHSQNINTNVQLGFQYQHIDAGPEGALGDISFEPQADRAGFSPKNFTYNPNQPAHINVDQSNTVWYQGYGSLGNPTIVQDARYTVQLDPSISLRGHAAGTHEAKIGIQSRFALHTNHAAWPGNRVYLDHGGPGPGDSGLCNEVTLGKGCFQYIQEPVIDQKQIGGAVGFFMQDRWRPARGLTIMPGIRFDYGTTYETHGLKVSNLFGIGPRLGINYDLTHDSKTIISAFYGRSNEVLSFLAAGNLADYPPVTTTFLYNSKLNQFQPFQAAGGAGGVQLDPNHGPGSVPHTDEVDVALRRELFHDSVAGVNYTYKRISNIWDGVEVNQIWDPTGTRVVGYVDGKAHQIEKVTTPDGNFRNYQGIDFTLESRPSPHWDLYGAYTLSWTYGPGADELGQIGGGQAGNSAFYNPRQAIFFDGFLPEDIRHRIILRASYNTHGLSIGGTLTYQTGAPLTHKYNNFTDGFQTNNRSPQGTDPGANANNATQIAEFRLPPRLTGNIRVAYDLNDLIHQHLIIIADLFNVFDLNAATSLINTDPGFGQVTGHQSQFRFQLGLRYIY